MKVRVPVTADSVFELIGTVQMIPRITRLI